MLQNYMPRAKALGNYRMAQTTEWLPAILDYMKNVKSNISMSRPSVVVEVTFRSEIQPHMNLFITRVGKGNARADLPLPLEIPSGRRFGI